MTFGWAYPPRMAIHQATITRLHRLLRKDRDHFDETVYFFATRGIWDLDELELAWERRRALSPVREAGRERRRLLREDGAVEHLAIRGGKILVGSDPARANGVVDELVGALDVSHPSGELPH